MLAAVSKLTLLVIYYNLICFVCHVFRGTIQQASSYVGNVFIVRCFIPCLSALLFEQAPCELIILLLFVDFWVQAKLRPLESSLASTKHLILKF